MQEKFYTVERIAEMLEMHPKTIQKYIREGKLRATKVGKAWRVSGHDLSLFVQANGEANPLIQARAEKSPEDKIMISSVVDIDVEDMDEAIRIVNMLTAGMNSKTSDYGHATMKAQFIEAELKVRVMLYGNIKFMEALLWYMKSYIDQ